MINASQPWAVARQLNAPLPPARKFRDGRVMQWDLAELLKHPDTLSELERDDSPLPVTEDRAGFNGERHLEYWLSGYRDARLIGDALGLREGARLLDFGGGSGRIIRHIARTRPYECHLSDINATWVAWVKRHLGSVTAAQNDSTPPLDYPAGYFDGLFATSVFTHLDEFELPWLMEMRRVVKPGGRLLLTIHDETFWEMLRQPQMEWMRQEMGKTQIAEFSERLQEKMPERYVLRYSNAAAHNCNVFLRRDYIERVWGAVFEIRGYVPGIGNRQVGVLLS